MSHPIGSLSFTVLTIGIVTCFSIVGGPGLFASGDSPAPQLRVEPAPVGLLELYVVEDSAGTELRQRLGRSEARDIRQTGSGEVDGIFRWLTWSEDGRSFFSSSGHPGSLWSAKREFTTKLRLKDRDLTPDDPLPEPRIAMPASGSLFLVQARLPWHPPMVRRVEELGCELTTYAHDHAYLARCATPEVAEILRKLDFVGRVEPFPCSMRLSRELVEWLEHVDGGDQDTVRVRVVTVKPGPKHDLAGLARRLGATAGADAGGGSLIEFDVTRDQLRQLACHDNFQYADVWQPAESYMDNVRIDAGADWLEQPVNGGYCGTGVRGEVLDSGFDTDHQEYASRMVLHGTVDQDVEHGTSTFGIVFSGGVVDAQSKGLLPCGTGIAGDYDDVTCGSCDRFDYTQESVEIYEASFQTNSWGRGPGPEYGTTSYDMEEIIWRLDMAILQAMNNEGKDNPQNVARDAWPKNIISVGATHHQDTLDVSDDWWCIHDCATLHAGNEQGCTDDPYCVWAVGLCFDNFSCGNIGPAEDGRIKPDIVYWYDFIYTTNTDPATGNDGYTSFGGTSASTPEAAGVMGLILEMWADTSDGGVNPWGHSPAGTTVFEKRPHSSTLKALIINSARQNDFSGTEHDMARMHQGWGRPNARDALERAGSSLVVDEETALEVGQKATWSLNAEPGVAELKATLAYRDPPKTLATGGKELINDLDLKVVSPPDGLGDVTVYCGNAGLDAGVESTALWTGPGPASATPDCDDPALAANRDDLNNVENVFVREAAPGVGITEGLWTVEVKAYEVPTDGNPDPTCREIDLDPDDPEAGRNACESAGCQWDGVRGVCGDMTFDVVFGLVVTGASVPTPGENRGLEVSRNAGDTLLLSWNGDCGGTTTYGVYRGDLNAGYDSIDQEPGQCSVSGTSTNIPLGAGNADFFLVVPNDGSNEGSYGANSLGDRRGPASTPCLPQDSIHECAP